MFSDDFREMVQKSRDMLCIHDPDGTYIYASPSTLTITGYDPEELLGKNPYDFFHPDDREAVRDCSHEPALQGDECARAEFRFMHKDGHAIWMETLTSLVKDSGGQVVRLHTISRDISSRVRQRESIQEQNVLLNMAQSLSGIGAWEVNLADNSVFWSAEIRKIHDVEDDNPLSVSDVLDFYVGRSREIAAEKLSRILRDGLGFDVKLQVRTRKGRLIWVRVVGEVLRIDGKPAKVYGVCQDIDQDYRRQQDLQHMVDALGARSRQLEDMHRMVSHNLRSTAGNIFTLAELMSESQRWIPEAGVALEKSARTLLASLDQIATLTRETIIPRLPEQPVSLRGVLDQVLLSFEDELQACEGSVQADFSRAEAILYPEIYLTNYFHNFISNAIKYRQPGRPPVILVETTLIDGWVVLEFRDNGLGIDLERYGQRLFGLNQRFHTSETGFSGEVSGSGLGLFICRNQIESLGGSIDVTSAPGRGTGFRLLLGTEAELIRMAPSAARKS